MTIKNLVDFINCHTNNGTIYSNESWEEGIAMIRSFSHSDWLALRTNLNLKEKSSFWVKRLIYLLDATYREEARQMIIYIALNGTEENFFDAMESIRKFRKNITIYTWLKLKNRSAKILKSRASI